MHGWKIRLFGIHIGLTDYTTYFEMCRECGGMVKIVTCLGDSVVNKMILDHLKESAILFQVSNIEGFKMIVSDDSGPDTLTSLMIDFTIAYRCPKSDI